MRYVPGLTYLDRYEGRWSLARYGSMVFLSGPVPIQMSPEAVDRYYGPLRMEDYQCDEVHGLKRIRCSKWYGHHGAHATEEIMTDLDDTPTPARPIDELLNDLAHQTGFPPTRDYLPTMPATLLTFGVKPGIPRPRASADGEVAKAMTVHCTCGTPAEHGQDCARFPARYHAPRPDTPACWDIDPRGFRCVGSPGHDGACRYADPILIMAMVAGDPPGTENPNQPMPIAAAMELAAAASIPPDGITAAFFHAARAAGSALATAANPDPWSAPPRADNEPQPGDRAPAPDPRAGYAVGNNQCDETAANPDSIPENPRADVECVGVAGHVGRHAGIYDNSGTPADWGVMYW